MGHHLRCADLRPALSRHLHGDGCGGDAANYSVGRGWGRRVLDDGRFSRVIKPGHVTQTDTLFARHGGKAVSLARFVPFVRTFAPFVAGISRMDRGRFTLFDVAGALAWVSVLLAAGYLFGAIPFIAQNLEYLVIGIIVLSLAQTCRARRASRNEKRSPVDGDPMHVLGTWSCG